MAPDDSGAAPVGAGPAAGRPCPRWLDLWFVTLGVGAFALLAWEALSRESGRPAAPLADEEAVRELGGRVVLVSTRPDAFVLLADGTRAVEGDRLSADVVLSSIGLTEIVVARDGVEVAIAVD